MIGHGLTGRIVHHNRQVGLTGAVNCQNQFIYRDQAQKKQEAAESGEGPAAPGRNAPFLAIKKNDHAKAECKQRKCNDLRPWLFESQAWDDALTRASGGHSESGNQGLRESIEHFSLCRFVSR